MQQRNYPYDWPDRRQAVLEKHLHRCVNCHEARGENLDVHHIVPVGQGGSHRRSNLVPLCRRCHEAAHGRAMAPCIRWYSNGELSQTEFSAHKHLWKRMRDRLGVPRYNPDEDCVYIPVADADVLVNQFET